MHNNITGAELPAVLALAYLGDARHSLYVRMMLVRRGISKSAELNELSLRYVTAEAQAAAYAKIEHLLLEDERDVFRRAYNSTHLNKPRRSSGKDYRTATGFEAVVGMLSYIGDEQRLDMLLEIALNDNEGDRNDTEN
ncbi:MAG: Mini-ribonuclease 3 [Ruminococcaceae bacterium]|nr:Mini-ribonuclease 3 [Oscillospiraceae bacterium]